MVVHGRASLIAAPAFVDISAINTTRSAFGGSTGADKRMAQVAKQKGQDIVAVSPIVRRQLAPPCWASA
jgi:hypothetical protein